MRHGWKCVYFAIKGDNVCRIDPSSIVEGELYVSLLVRTFGRGVVHFSVAYAPMYPAFSFQQATQLGEDLATVFRTTLADFAHRAALFLPMDTVCVRFDPDLAFDTIEQRDTFSNSFSWQSFMKTKKKPHQVLKAASDIQPPDTVLLDLAPSKDAILANMKSKWRYNVRLASKKGVDVRRFAAGEEDFSQAFESFFSLFMETSKRDAVEFHEKGYYQDLLEAGSREGESATVRLYLAFHEGEALAGIIVLFLGNEAVYLYGASGNKKRNLMPAYLLQWTAICDAKDAECSVYDFYGCPPTDDPHHPMHGLFLFKTGFGGKLVHRAGTYDVVLKKPQYILFSIAEKARSWFYKVAKKKFSRGKGRKTS